MACGAGVRREPAVPLVMFDRTAQATHQQGKTGRVERAASRTVEVSR
jgi:hypothetical protein